MLTLHTRSYRFVWMLLGLFIVVGLLSAGGGMRSAAIEALSLTRDGLGRGEIYRLVTYVFLTGDTWELLFKVLIVYFMAAPIEAAWGSWRFLTLFLVSAVGGGLTAAATGVPLVGGWAVTMTLILVHGFMFPESIIYLFFVLPIRVKTLALFLTTFFLVGCLSKGWTGLAYFIGMLSGAGYYFIATRSRRWVRMARRSIAEGAVTPADAARKLATDRLMERARRIMRLHDDGTPLDENDRAFVEELIRRSDPAKEICSPYSFSPDNMICPPCREFGRCLRRRLETGQEAEDHGEE